MSELPDYPTVRFGFVLGWFLRLETNGGGERTFLQKHRFLRNAGPWECDGMTWAVTHLQKQSAFGFLLMRPFCFHFWFMPKKQEQAAGGGWIPGTERGLYMRTPGYRWDAGDGKFIRTKGYFGLHWD